MSAGRRIATPSTVVAAAFVAGAGLRVAFLVLYRPAFLGDPDSGTYIDAAHHGLFSNAYDPAGYPLLIRFVHLIDPHLGALVVLQHVLGLATAALIYLAVRGETGSGLLGLLPAAVVLFDGYGLWVEHTPITESVFTFLVALALYLTFAGLNRAKLLVAAGAVVAAASVVRPVGLTMIPVFAGWVLWCRPGSRRIRAVSAAALVAPAVAGVAAYLLVQQAETGFFGLTRDSGRVLYARVATFADCSRFKPPAGTATLCERIPSAARGSFNQYLTGSPDHARPGAPIDRSISPAWRVFGPPPAGSSKLQAFALTVLVHQPLEYLGRVASDFHYYWADHHRAFIAADAHVDPNVERAVTTYYATGPGVGNEGLGFLRWYGKSIEVIGPVTIALLLLPFTGALSVEQRSRRAAALFTATGWLLPLVADAVASVDPRFILPAYGPLAAATAIGVHGTWLHLGVAHGERRGSETVL